MADGAHTGGGGGGAKGSREPSAAALPLDGRARAGLAPEQARDGRAGPAVAGDGESEIALVLRAQQGDVLAMSALLDRLSPWLARLCGAVALEQADDAAQEVLVQILRDLPTLREPAALRAWARRIAVRESIRQARRARTQAGGISDAGARVGARTRVDGDPADRGGEASAGIAQDPGVARDVRAVLARLGPEQRAILVLRDLEGLSEAEASTLLGVARGTVKSRLARAREAFIARWSES